ncbi:hypothetical protein ACFQX7_39775 [Luedemannella flava]
MVASSLIVFASSLDDFVISSFLSADASSVTVPIRLYSSVRNAPSPALNALATLLLLGSALTLCSPGWCCAACAAATAPPPSRNSPSIDG